MTTATLDARELSRLMQGAYDALLRLDAYVYAEVADGDPRHRSVRQLAVANDVLVEALDALPGEFVAR